jgi:hypothetical protein
MRATTTLNLMLCAALAAATFAAVPAHALDRYEDGSRLSGAGLKPSQPGSVAARGARTATDEASREPASAAAPCPDGRIWLNGTSLNGAKLDGVALNGTGDAAGTGAPQVTAVRLPDGRTFAVAAR